MLQKLGYEVRKQGGIRGTAEDTREDDPILGIRRQYLISLVSVWNCATCTGATPSGDQPVRLNPTLLSHPDSSTYTR